MSKKLEDVEAEVDAGLRLRVEELKAELSALGYQVPSVSPEQAREKLAALKAAKEAQATAALHPDLRSLGRFHEPMRPNLPRL